MINFQCECGKSYNVKDEMAGRTGPCQQCGQVITVPSPNPFAVPVPPIQQTPPAPKQLFCTNCGNTVSEQAVACMSCGARPTGHKKFCRQCGVALNPEQIVCIKCGAGLTATSGRFSIVGNPFSQAKKINVYFMVYWICLTAGITLSLPFTLLSIVIPKQQEKLNPDAAPLIAGLILLWYFGYIVIIVGIVSGCMLFYQFWQQIPKDIARTTPGKALGFSFIPLFNFYWMFVAYKGLAEDMNKTLHRYRIQYQVNEKLGISLCILAIIANIPFNLFSPLIGTCIGLAIMAATFVVGILFFKSVKDGAIALLEQEGQ